MTEMAKFFSIIMPVYKVERYFKQAVNSVLSQPFDDFELILIDDASPDKCGEMCDEFALNDKRVRVIHNESNMGITGARNVGLAAAQGEWIWFVDSDDWISDNSLSEVASLANSDIEVLAFGTEYYFEQSDYSVQKIMRKIPPARDMISNSDELVDFVMNLDYRHAFAALWNKIYRRSFLVENNISFKEDYLEDAFFNYLVFSHVTKAKSVNKSFYNYRRRTAGSLSKNTSFNNTEIYKKRYFVAKNFLKEKNSSNILHKIRIFCGYIDRKVYVLYVNVVSKLKVRN